MATTGRKLTAAVEEYLAELRRIGSTGGGTGELSYYPPFNNLLNAVGGSLRPKVYCVSLLAQQVAGHPDWTDSNLRIEYPSRISPRDRKFRMDKPYRLSLKSIVLSGR